MSHFAVKLLVRSLVLASLAVSVATPASAGVYKCTSSQGKVEFSDSPCEKGFSGSQLTVRPNSLSSAEDRNAALKAENQRLLERSLRQQNDDMRQKLEEEQGARPSRVSTPSDAQADLAASAACQRAKREYETSSSSIKPNRALLEAQAAAMRSACGMREPDKVINKTTVNVNALLPYDRGAGSSPR